MITAICFPGCLMILETWETRSPSFKTFEISASHHSAVSALWKIAYMMPKGFALHKKNKLKPNSVSVPGSHPDGSGCSVVGMKTLEIKKREEVVCVCVSACRGSVIWRKTAVKRKGGETNVRATVHEIKRYLWNTSCFLVSPLGSLSVSLFVCLQGRKMRDIVTFEERLNQ